jgi:hypothetical protein
MDITKETVRELRHGWQTVGTTPIQVSPLELNALKGVLMTCPGSAYPGEGNDAPIWIGGPKVTADDGPGGGLPVMPGSSMFIPIERVDLLYVISTMENQKIAWMLL